MEAPNHDGVKTFFEPVKVDMPVTSPMIGYRESTLPPIIHRHDFTFDGIALSYPWERIEPSSALDPYPLVDNGVIYTNLTLRAAIFRPEPVFSVETEVADASQGFYAVLLTTEDVFYWGEVQQAGVDASLTVSWTTGNMSGQLGIVVIPPLVVGDKIRLSKIGTQVILYLNDTAMITVQDSQTNSSSYLPGVYLEGNPRLRTLNTRRLEDQNVTHEEIESTRSTEPRRKARHDFDPA